MKLRWPAFLRFGRKADHYLEAFNELFGQRLAKSGATVNWDTALKVSTVLACARVRAQGMAQVPLKVFRELENGSKNPDRTHPLYFLLHNQPNEWQTSYEFREMLSLHLDLAGRQYSFINRVAGEIVELIPFEPGQVRPERANDGEITYHVTMKNGSQKPFPQEAIWHVRGLSWNGWEGMDPMYLAREAVGLAISAEEQHARLFANGISPSGVYSVEGTLSPQQYKDLRKFIADNYTGDKSGLPMIVDRAAKWLPLTRTGVEAQHIEVRRFQVQEICRGMNVMPIMVGHDDKSVTYASAEQMFLAHVVHTLLPMYTRVQQSIDAHLIGRKGVEQGYYSKFIAAALLQGAMKDRAEYYAKALGSGGSLPWMTQDEVRALEEMNPMGGTAAQLQLPANLAGGAPAKQQEEGASA